MRTFIDKLIYGATARLAEEPVIYGHGLTPAGEAIAAALPPPDAPPKDFVKARSLLATSITRLMSRRDVLVKEIEDRSAELFETNRTLEALANAEAAIYEIGKASTEAEVPSAMIPGDKGPEGDRGPAWDTINEAELAEILSQGDAGVYANPYVDMLPEDTTADLKATSPGSLLREATAASSDQLTHLDARFRPKGFA